MIIFACIIVWIVYSCLEGFRDARHFYYRASSARQDKYNEHIGFAIQRIVAWLPFEYVLFDPNNHLTALNGVFLALMFILFHDGVYFLAYNKLAAVYPLGFWSSPNALSTSWWDRHDLTNVILRITYFVVGICGLIIINYAKY